jgi:hypothetical protein
MKQADVARAVFDILDAAALVEVEGGGAREPVTDLASVALVPWYCDPSVQWAVRLTPAGAGFKQSPLKRIKGCHIAVSSAGALVIGIPGDGIEPSTYALLPLAAALAQVVEPGMRLELAAANLGTVKRDWDVKAETSTRHGDQRYSGSIDHERTWHIDQTTPSLTPATLEAALTCGRMVTRNGPWQASDRAEAYAVVLTWLGSRQANVNPKAVARFITLQNDAFLNSDPGMTRKLCGLGLAFFRHRLAGGPFQWADVGTAMHSQEEVRSVADAVVGARQ